MQAFQRAAAVFCMACIGAELVSLFGGQGWAGRCIKAVAGLYILAVLLAQLPHLQGRVAAAFSGNTAPAAPSAIQSDVLETEILTQTKARLEEYCAVQCRQQFGLDIRVTVTLEKAGQQVVVKKAVAAFPAGCTAVGIRAHDFTPCTADTPNAIPVKAVSTSENPFDWNLICTPPEGTAQLWWKVSKKSLSSAAPAAPQHLCAAPESIMPLKG